MSLFKSPSTPNPETGISLGNQIANTQQQLNANTASTQYGYNLQTAGQQANLNALTAEEQAALNQATAQSQLGYNTGIAALQQQYNTGAQAGSQYNQYNPYGNLNYMQTGTGPNGVPIYSAVESFSPVEQGLFNTYTGTQGTAGQQAANLLQQANYGSVSPAQAIGNMTSGLTGQVLGAEVSSLEPYFNIQSEQEAAALANQGITPTANPTAYNNAMLPFLTSQNTTVENFLASAEPQAFSQATTAYGLPLSMATQEMGLSAPQSPNAMFTSNTPALSTTNVAGVTVSPTTLANTTISPTTVANTNLTNAVSAENTALQNQYTDQQNQYNAMLSGLMSVGSGLLGSTGGLSGLGSTLGNVLSGITGYYGTAGVNPDSAAGQQTYSSSIFL